MIRYFFKAVRLVLGPLLLLKEALSKPKGIVRTPQQQAAVDAQCEALALYQFKTCPFCIKTRQEMRRLSLNIQKVDAQPDGADRQALFAATGETKVPCLRITDTAGKSQWLQESDKIVAYLRGRFADV
jgi:glutaredoxin